ncbi:hypothetical protein [Hyalangium versicolor]|uniref:hypothetical protein n=1 Tax=Hyalangium versicolor TaxID=2861190 RepID=UPI001CD02950|nr:hypothetical protein [Hyalangium versicolor]
MPSCEVLVNTEGSTPGPLASAWVYIQEGGTTTTYRTAPNGRLRKMAPGGSAADGTRPWKFDTKAVIDVPKTVRIYTSRGARPIPQSILDNTIFNNAQAYVERTIALPPSTAPVAIASTDQTVVAISVAEVAVPPVSVALTLPRELSLCPVLWDHTPEDATDDNKDYLRAGITQGATTPAEDAVPAAPPGAVVVHERGVRIQGTVGNNAQHTRIRMVGPAGTVLGLRTSATGSRVEELVVATTGAGSERSFEADVWIDDPTQSFGLVHVVVDSSDTADSRHWLDSFTVFLVGLQLALVDDATNNLNGSSAGQISNQAQEKIVLDFKKSPVRDVASSNLFLHAYKVRNQASKAISNKTKNVEAVKTAFSRLKTPRDNAATALATAVAQTSAAQAKAKLTVAKTKLTALKTAVTNAGLTAKITEALTNTPEREVTADPAFNVAMQELATAFTAINTQLSPACTEAVTALTTALTTAEQKIDEALTQVNTELSATALPAAKAAANAARMAATNTATAQFQAFETSRAAGLTAATAAGNLMTPTTAPTKVALQHADTRKEGLLDEAKQKANAELTKERRARRMIRYVIRGDQKRKFNGTGPEVPHPQMPMFMAELHVFGVQKAPIEELLQRRKRSVPAVSGLTQSLRMEIDWRFRLKWKGPDVDPPVSPPDTFHDANAGGYSLNQEFRGVWTSTKLQAVAQGVTLTIGDDDTLTLESDAVKDAFTPVPVKLPFPVATRRTPIVAIANRQRAWGRAQGAKNAAAMVVEWQVPVVDSTSREILRGGDGFLTVAALSIDGQRVARGTSATVASAQSDLQLVPFRVSGDNAPANAINANDPMGQMIETVVGETYEKLAATHVARNIDVSGWKLAYRRTVAHESRARQFNGSTWADFRHWEGNMVWSYGQERGMPLHGHPHGYTMAQCDPHPSDDAMWSYIDAIRAGIKVMFDKALVAKSDLEKKANQANAAYQAKVAAGTVTPQDQDPAASLDLTIAKHREALLRAAVKRYNGGTEFVWGHPHGYVAPAPPATPAPMSWVISPSTKNDYPNMALGTNVNYSQTEPIEFTQFVLPATP